MAQADPLLLSKLKDDVHQALRLWREADSNESPLHYLFLVQQAQRRGAGVREATNEVILEALKILDVEAGVDAKLLRSRFPDDQAAHVTANQLNMAESTIFTRQRQAIAHLAKIIQAQEDQARAKYRADLESRLEPLSYSQLIGIEDHLDRLLGLLTALEPPWLISIEGLGGLGKTSLADALSRRVINEGLFDNFGWISARQRTLNLDIGIRPVNTPALTAEDLIEKLAAQLLTDRPKSNPFLVQEIYTALRTRLKQSRHLLVIDNLETVSDLEVLLPTLRDLANPSKFLLTSRESRHYEPDLYHFRLPELTEANALRLVRHEAHLHHLLHLAQANDEVLKPIFETVGGNPLALRLVVGQTHAHALGLILSQLTAARGEQIETLYAFIYHQAWDRLDEPTRRVLLAMPLVTEYGGSVDYLADVTTLDYADLVNALHELIKLNLVDSVGDLTERCYTLHHLTRTFLLNQARWQLSTSDLVAPTDYVALFQDYVPRSLQHSLSKIQQASAVWLPADQAQALHGLSFALKLSDAWPATCALLLALAPKMEQQGYHDEWLPYLEQGLYQSQVVADVAVEAELRFQLGLLYELRGQYPEARVQFASSAACFAKLDSPLNQARALNQVAYVARRQRQFVEAVQVVDEALRLLDEQSPERAYSYLVLGTIALDKQAWSEAVDFFQQSLQLWEQTNNQRMLACSLTNLGAAWRPMAKYQKAIQVYAQAINLLEEIQDPINQAVAQMNLGNVYLDLKEPDRALELYEPAERVFRHTLEPLRLAKIYNNIGEAHRQKREWVKAEQCLLLSIQGCEEIGHIPSLINALAGLGQVYLDQGALTQAKSTFEQALQRLAQIEGDPRFEQLKELVTQRLSQAADEEIIVPYG